MLKKNSFLNKTKKIKQPAITNINDNDIGPSEEISKSMKKVAIKKKKNDNYKIKYSFHY